jgi:hypothetical protein
MVDKVKAVKLEDVESDILPDGEVKEQSIGERNTIDDHQGSLRKN